MTRYVAKNIVANELANECLISVAYSFGKEQPVMLTVQTGTEKSDQQILNLIQQKFDFRPNAIIELLNLRKTSYKPTATYGHFTSNDYPWEKLITI